jgi:hypothetical protein
MNKLGVGEMEKDQLIIKINATMNAPTRLV